MKRSLPVFFFLFFSGVVYAQWDDSDLLPAEFHQQRRAALRARLQPGTAAVFFANPVRNRSNDVDFQFSQDPDFYYLTGCMEPNAAFILLKEPRIFDGVKTDELLFVQERNAKAETWTGKRLGVEGARERLGFKAVYRGIELKDFGINWSALNEVLVRYPEQPNDSKQDKADLGDLVNYFRESLAGVSLVPDSTSLRKHMAVLREIKEPEELLLMQKAMDITISGFKEMMRKMSPGMKEYEAQAIVEYHAKKEGSEYMGYPSICGGGDNSCVLHYTFNRKQLKPEEILLVDMGAEYHGYTADITRTVPVKGTFSPEQAAIYTLVLAAQDSGISACIAGNPFRAAHNKAASVIGKGLVELGIISDPGELSKYFMHGTSHYLGLDVHDAGTYEVLKPGVVMTVEPGIYIPAGAPCDRKWWGIGVRIEDDILVTDDQPVIMTSALPRTIQEIEKLMAEDF